MSCNTFASTANRPDRLPDKADFSHVIRRTLQSSAVILTAASLAACAQSPTVPGKSASLAGSRSVSPQNVQAATVAKRRTIVGARRHTPFAKFKTEAQKSGASSGIASYYGHGSQTANGEAFNPQELTAAHRTLPFGTRLRVTNVATGQSVTVRVNDRGPFVSGRIIDISTSAAETLGIIDQGIAKVKVDVVRN